MEDHLYYIWQKGEKLSLSNNFSASEFECRCKSVTCEEQRISKELINNLQKLRDQYGEYITVTSGYRCKEHNKKIGSSDTSQHPLGNAADVTARDMDRLYSIAENYFEAIGDARISTGNRGNFIHVDTRRGKKRRWDY